MRNADIVVFLQEHHLQVIIAAAHDGSSGGKIAQLSIPTPDAVASKIKYDELYPHRFAQPATYIRFSSTVEDSIGCPYCMSEADEVWLSARNRDRRGEDVCGEDEFEEVMNFFEETSLLKQPFAAVDNTPVLPVEEMEESYDEMLRLEARRFIRDIYPHWKSERLARHNRPLMVKLKTLKMDTGQDADDADPFVCFRRREVRQVRKTRGRDAQIAEKLKRLRKELEDARHLLSRIREREHRRKEDLNLSRKIFEQRAALRESKRLLNIPDEDEDLLITAKTPKKRPVEVATASKPQAGSQLKLISRQESVAPPEPDVVKLKDLVEQRDQKVRTQINSQIEKHEAWNLKFFDRTLEAILGIDDNPFEDNARFGLSFANFRTEWEQLPTPPDSVDSDDEQHERPAKRVRLAHSKEQSSLMNAPRMRIRRGRGGRLMIDRHNMRLPGKSIMSPLVADRFKYDLEDGDDEMLGLKDPYSDAVQYRQDYNVAPRIREPSQGQAQTALAQIPVAPVRDVVMTNGAGTAGAEAKAS